MITDQFDVEFTKSGAVHDPAQVRALLEGLPDASDLLVLAHGWNNDLSEARELYDELTANLERLPQPASGPGSRVVVMRVFWPSKKFADEDLVPGGGASSTDAENAHALVDALDTLKHDPDRLGQPDEDPVRAAAVDRAVTLLDDLDWSEGARREFVLQIRALLDPGQTHEDDASREFFTLDPEELFDRFGQPIPLELEVEEGGAATLDEGGAAFLGDLLSGARAAARRIANFATYYQMKVRAGTVGAGGVATTLARVRERHPGLAIHLVGHSFGGRLVTAAASRFDPGHAPVTLTLLQAAFSHNGLSRAFDGTRDGAFRTVLQDRRISGPVLITHTKRDRAVGIAYPLASRIASDNAAGLGDRKDPYGGMGRNGAQHTPEVDASVAELGDDRSSYAFSPGVVYNLRADRRIAHHGDVRNPAVANLVRHAVTTR
jgi:esterase/lipase superfamily enzyme